MKWRSTASNFLLSCVRSSIYR